MLTLSEFNAALQTEFGGRLRCRWSAERREYHIEQKVGRGIFDPPLPGADTESDRWVRARDGYSLVMSIQRGDRMACPTCGLTMKVPVLRIAEAVCAYCRDVKKRDVSTFAAYYPLGWTLIDHLKSIDPERDGHRRQMAEVEASNAALQESADESGLVADLMYDALVSQIPQVGYTGKEMT